jgi:RNA polymerase sigma-70 factor, ECF subfamily
MDDAPLTFGQLLERYERELFAYAIRLSGQRADAEDLFQDTFLAAFRGWPPPRRGNERAWLYRIATNRAIDRERRAKRVVANVDDLALAAPERGDATLLDLAGAIRTLPAGQRAAFVLRKVQGLGYAEIAVALECSQEAARGRVSEALKKVKAAVA